MYRPEPTRSYRSKRTIRTILISLFGVLALGSCGLLTWLIASGVWNGLVNGATAFLSQTPNAMISQTLAFLASVGILFYCVLPVLGIALFIGIIFLISRW